MTILTRKFSQFSNGGDLQNGETTVGLDSGTNTYFNNPWTFLASGSTASRPTPSAAINYRLRLNTDLQTYEYYNPIVMQWTELSGSGTGTVNPGITNAIAYYAANGTTLSPIDSADNSVFVTDSAGVPSFETTLPGGIHIPSAVITASTAALTSGQVAATPVNPTDIANKAYVDASFSSGVTSITGTTNQVIASSPTGAVTLSLPQDIALGSSPTFSALTLSSSTAHAVLIAQGATAINSVLLGAGQILIGTTSGDPAASAINSGTNILVANASGSITIGLTGVIAPTLGGTGVNNGSNTLTLAGNLATSGAFNSTFTMTGATNVTFPTSGTLATTGQLPTPAALTKTDDTNVTLTLGGTPATALLQATSLTLGWTGTLAVGRGGTGVSSVTVAPTATAFAGWDANKNLSANSFIPAFTTTVSSASPIVLTVASTQLQYITGSTAQTFTMPVTSTLVAGMSWIIVNLSSATATVNSSGGNAIVSLPAGSQATVTCILNSGTTAASWSDDFGLNTAGVATITGTANQVIASAATGNVTLSLPQSIATTSAVQFNSVQFNSLNAILDSNGNTMIGLSAQASSVNNVIIYNAPTTVAPIVQAFGTDTNVLLQLSGKGNLGVGIQGTSTNNNAVLGNVGESVFVQVLFGSPVSFTSGVTKNLTSVLLGAGDWDVWGNFGANATTYITSMVAGCTATSATLPDNSLVCLGSFAASTTGANIYAVPMQRFSLSTSTTVYLAATIGGVGTLTGYGFIAGRRVR